MDETVLRYMLLFSFYLRKQSGLLDSHSFHNRFLNSFLSSHLKRHWDINIRPHEYIDWFVADWRRSVERVRVEVEKRVRHLERAWNSYLKSLLPSDSWVWKMYVDNCLIECLFFNHKFSLF